MTRDLWSRKARMAMAVLLAGAWGSLATVISLGPASAVDPCVPQQHTDAVKTFTLDDTTLQGGQTVRIDFTGAIPDGSCAGDTVVIAAPPNFPLRNGATPLLDADGVELGTMTVADNNAVTITFNEYVQTHDNVTFGGHFYGRLSGSQPETGYDLTWDLGDGQSLSTPVTTNSCVGCSEPRTRGGKSVSLTDDHEIHIFFDSPITTEVGQVVTFTDVVGAGQRMDCSRFSGAIGSRTVWGNLVLDGGPAPVTVVSCDDAGFTATMTSTATGQYLDLQGYAVTTEDRSTYPDSGTVTQDGHTDQVSAVAREYTVGAEGSGDTKHAAESTQPTPTGTVTATPTDPVTSTPTDPVTSTPTDPVPSTPTDPVPSEGGNQSPTAPSTPPSTQPSTPPSNPGDTPSNTPNDTPRHTPHTPSNELPETGLGPATAAAAVGGVALLTAGFVLVATSRRRRVNPS